MIFVISDDVFFSLGLNLILKDAKLPVTVIDSPTLHIIEGSVTHKDILIFDADFYQQQKKTTINKIDKKPRVIYFYDVHLQYVENNFGNPLFFSKKINIHVILDILFKCYVLNGFRMNVKYPHSSLTQLEEDIMKCYIKSTDIYRTSKIMNIPVKKLYAIKNKVLKKMGLCHLNSVALLIYSDVYSLNPTTKYRESTYHNIAQCIG